MISITQEIKEVNITIEQNGNSITLQPVLLKNGGNCDCDIDGGSL